MFVVPQVVVCFIARMSTFGNWATDGIFVMIGQVLLAQIFRNASGNPNRAFSLARVVRLGPLLEPLKRCGATINPMNKSTGGLLFRSRLKEFSVNLIVIDVSQLPKTHWQQYTGITISTRTAPETPNRRPFQEFKPLPM